MYSVIAVCRMCTIAGPLTGPLDPTLPVQPQVVRWHEAGPMYRYWPIPRTAIIDQTLSQMTRWMSS